MNKFIVLGMDGATPYVIDEALHAGRLPNVRRLVERGVYAHNLPFPSAVTPGNWSAIASGARPWSVGISDFRIHVPGEPLNVSHGCFMRPWCDAELFWESLGREGRRCATVSYVAGRPRSGEHHLSIGDDGMPAENSLAWMVAPARLFVHGERAPVGPYDWREHEVIRPEPLTQRRNLPASYEPLNEYRVNVRAVNPGCKGEFLFRCLIVHCEGEPRLVLSSAPDYDRRLTDVACRTWTDWMETDFDVRGRSVDCCFRFRLVHGGRNDLQLYLSPVYPVYEFAEPAGITADLVDRLGPYCDGLNISKLLMGWYDDEALLDEFSQQGLWQAQAAVELLRRHRCTGVFTKWHAFDKFYHFFFHKIDPASPFYEPAERERYERIHQGLLLIADAMVGAVLDEMDDETVLVVVSDHGLMPSRRHANVNNWLVRNGYLAVDFKPDGSYEIDWSRTRAVVAPYVQLWLNRKGRDPHGIVAPGDADALCTELVAGLRGWRDDETGEPVFDEVFRIADGAFYGLGHARDGDIRFHTTPGISLYRRNRPTADGVLVAPATPPYFGDHGSCRPTARFGRGSERGIFFAAGAGVSAVGRRAHPIQPCDIVPTLCTLIDALPPANCEGAVLCDILA